MHPNIGEHAFLNSENNWHPNLGKFTPHTPSVLELRHPPIFRDQGGVGGMFFLLLHISFHLRAQVEP